MKFRKPHLTALLTAAGIALAAPLAAQANPAPDGPRPGCDGHGYMDRGDRAGPHGEFGMFGGGHGPRYLRGLNLTDEQQDKIFNLMYAQAPAMRAKMKDLREARSNLEALTRAPSYDEAKVRALTDKAATAMAEMARMHARTEYQIYQLLTPEQRQQLSERKDRWDDMRPGGTRPGPGMGPGPRQG